MWMIKLAWKNLWRNRSRTSLSIAAVYFAVVLSSLAGSLKTGIFDNLIKNVVSFYTGYIQIHKQGYFDEQMLDNGFYIHPSTIKKIHFDKNVSSVTTRLESFILASSEEKTKGCLLTGIIPEKENQVTNLKNKITEGEYLTKDDKGVIIASGLAKRLNVQLHDTIVLLGQGYHGTTAAGKFRIKGLLKFGAPDLNEKTVFMSLPAVQDLFNANEMGSSYIISLIDTKQLHTTATRLKSSLGKEYEVMTWEEIMPEVKQHIETDSNNMNYIQGILYLLVSFGILSTFIIMMTERKYELGMLIAIGMSKIKLMGVLFAESMMLLFSGCILGILSAIPLLQLLKTHPLRIGGETEKAYERFGFEAIFPASTDPSNLIRQIVVVVVIGVLLSAYPIYRIIKLNPATDIKR